MLRATHTSLDFLGKPYIEYQEAVSEYRKLREELFGELKRKVFELISTPRNSDESVLMPLGKMNTQTGMTWRGKEIPSEEIDVQGIMLDGGVITSREAKHIDGYSGNPYVFKSFFGKDVRTQYFTTHSGETLKIQFEKEKADIIEQARYEGIRYKEGLLFQAFMRELGEDFKAIFLYSASGIPEVRLQALRDSDDLKLPRLGEWDYVDGSYQREDVGKQSQFYEEGAIKSLREIGILNPFCIKAFDDFWTKSANEIEAWKFATLGNKTTRIVPSYVGGMNWPPEEVQYGTYDITYAESDQTNRQITSEELLRLTRRGGYIIIPTFMLRKMNKFKSDINILLRNIHGDFSLIQKKS